MAGQQPPGKVGRNQRESPDLVMRSLGGKALSVGRMGQPSVTDRRTDTAQDGLCMVRLQGDPGPRELASELGLSRGTHRIRLGG